MGSFKITKWIAIVSVLGILSLLLITKQANAQTLGEYYDTGDDDATTITGSTLWRGQTFTPTSTHDFSELHLYMYKDAGSTANVLVDIYAVDVNHKPTGSSLGQASTAASAINDTTPTWAEFIWGTAITLTGSTEYAYVVHSTGGNYILRYDASSPTYAGGLYLHSADTGATWTTYTTREMMFREYYTDDIEEPPPGGGETTTTSTITIVQNPTLDIAMGYLLLLITFFGFLFFSKL